MKKEVTDIQALHVELDAEDRELMGLFPARRQMAMNDMLIVRERDVIYLVSKIQLARRQKMIQDIIDVGTVGVAGFVVLVQTILMVKRVVNPLDGGDHLLRHGVPVPGEPVSEKTEIRKPPPGGQDRKAAEKWNTPIIGRNERKIKYGHSVKIHSPGKLQVPQIADHHSGRQERQHLR